MTKSHSRTEHVQWHQVHRSSLSGDIFQKRAVFKGLTRSMNACPVASTLTVQVSFFQVKAWEKHAGDYLRDKKLVQSTNANLSAANRQLRRRVDELGAAEAHDGSAALPAREAQNQLAPALRKELGAAMKNVAKGNSTLARRGSGGARCVHYVSCSEWKPAGIGDG
jgi:hypothetical protein